MEQLTDLKAILHSKRANIYYLEKCRVMQKDGRVLYLTEAKNENQYWNIPIANTTCLLQNRKIEIKGKEIGVTSDGKEDFICLTDIARYKNPEVTGLVISHWLSTRYTIEFMVLWEKCTTLILMLPNSVILETDRAQTALSYRANIGLAAPIL